MFVCILATAIQLFFSPRSAATGRATPPPPRREKAGKTAAFRRNDVRGGERNERERESAQKVMQKK